MKTIIVTQLFEQDGKARTKKRRIDAEFIKHSYPTFIPPILQESVKDRYNNLTELQLERDGRSERIYVLESCHQIEQSIKQASSTNLIYG